MYELYPYFTNDGSVGLYSPDADDIYHSTYGALSEAYEKFVIPAELNNFLNKKSEIKLLDICFGIGYNSKSFLNYIFDNLENFYLPKKVNHNKYIAQIDTNKTSNTENNYTIDTDNNKFTQHNGTIDSNNIFSRNPVNEHKKIKIFIKAIDTDKNLLFLSPFFKNGNKSDIKNNQIDFYQEKISKFLKKEFNSKYKLKGEINIILLEKIIENHPEIFEDFEFQKILSSEKYKRFFDKGMLTLFKFHKDSRSLNTSLKHISTFLHNIYYRYLSNRYKNSLKYLKSLDFIFETKIEDARVSLKQDPNKYDFVFLDAFTPAKCPALWTIDFFKLLYEHLDNDGMVLTYSNSTSVRNAFLNAGFHVGKIYNSELKKFTGTVAVKNKLHIKYPLSEYDLGLLKTRAGIFYRDENLNALNEAIIKAQKIEFENSNLMTSSKFIKEFRRNNEI